jgi:amino acid transporter, AAT family
MLFSLSRGQYAPAWLGRLSRRGVPHSALAISAFGMIVAILLALFAPKNAFLLLYGTAVAGMFFVWIVILLTHLRFRQSISVQTQQGLPLRLRAHPLPTLASIAAIGAIAVSTFWVDGLRYTLLTFAPFLLVMSVLYLKTRNQLNAKAE